MKILILIPFISALTLIIPFQARPSLPEIIIPGANEGESISFEVFTDSSEVKSDTTTLAPKGQNSDEINSNQSKENGSSPCQFLDGHWYNSLGSELILMHNKDGALTGQFRTAVESTKGSAGIFHSNVMGYAHPHDKSHDTRSTIGFVVSWKDGESTTSWTGQCKVCNGKETLQTTWILTSHVDTCNDLWKANRVGQDIFTKYEVKLGPRKQHGIHTPRDYEKWLKYPDSRENPDSSTP